MKLIVDGFVISYYDDDNPSNDTGALFCRFFADGEALHDVLDCFEQFSTTGSGEPAHCGGQSWILSTCGK
jgi:hypothetical protein